MDGRLPRLRFPVTRKHWTRRLLIDLPFRSLRGVVQSWTNPTLQSAALERLDRQAPGTTAVLSGNPLRAHLETGSPGPTSSEQESLIRLWFSRGTNWRIETTVGGVSETYVAVGDTWRLWNGLVVITGALPATGEPPHVLSAALAMMISPGHLLSQLRLSPSGSRTIAGRDAADFTATPGLGARGLWPGADGYALSVDAQSHILLRLQILVGGGVVSRSEFVELVTDDEVDASVFNLEVPNGTTVLRAPPGDPLELVRSRPAHWPAVRRTARLPWTKRT